MKLKFWVKGVCVGGGGGGGGGEGGEGGEGGRGATLWIRPWESTLYIIHPAPFRHISRYK